MWHQLQTVRYSGMVAIEFSRFVEKCMFKGDQGGYKKLVTSAATFLVMLISKCALC